MLFVVDGIFRANWDEEGDRETLRRFETWTPASGAEMTALFARADGRGIFALFEAQTAIAIYESLLPYTPFFEYEVVPVVEASEAVPVLRRIRGLD
jgi:hypothetical protein